MAPMAGAGVAPVDGAPSASRIFGTFSNPTMPFSTQ
jgi:hypothetical protein